MMVCDHVPSFRKVRIVPNADMALLPFVDIVSLSSMRSLIQIHAIGRLETAATIAKPTFVG